MTQLGFGLSQPVKSDYVAVTVEYNVIFDQ